jgi:hypothetical protein
MQTLDKRKFRRFKLEYPVRVSFSSGDVVTEAGAVSRNISLGGLLLESACLIPYRTPVELVITLRGGTIFRPVKLRGAGEIVRVEPNETGDKFAIAVECSQPINSNGASAGDKGLRLVRFLTRDGWRRDIQRTA